MSEIKTGGPAFPRDHAHEGHNGMTLRQYAAIKLKVPDSGTDWLDEMIVKSLRNDFAAKAMQAIVNRDRDDSAYGSDMMKGRSVLSHEYADEMIKARKAK